MGPTEIKEKLEKYFGLRCEMTEKRHWTSNFPCRYGYIFKSPTDVILFELEYYYSDRALQRNEPLWEKVVENDPQVGDIGPLPAPQAPSVGNSIHCVAKLSDTEEGYVLGSITYSLNFKALYKEIHET